MPAAIAAKLRRSTCTWPDPAILQRVVGKLPWGQSIELLRVKNAADRVWYAEAALEHGWSRPVLAAQIDTRLHERQGRAVTNFGRVLPPDASDLAQQILKDPYQFDFLTLQAAARERDLEQALVARIKDLLLELGKGFPFIASTALRSEARNSTSTCCFTTGGYAALLQST